MYLFLADGIVQCSLSCSVELLEGDPGLAYKTDTGFCTLESGVHFMESDDPLKLDRAVVKLEQVSCASFKEVF
jgi:hypothetical protein